MAKHEDGRKKIRDGMSAKNISINQLSCDANTDVSTLRKFLRGKCGMGGVKTIEKILTAFSDQVQPSTANTSNSTGIIGLSLDQLRPSPYNPRTTVDALAIEELANSIAAKGLLQKLIACPCKDAEGHFETFGGYPFASHIPDEVNGVYNGPKTT